MSEILDEIKQSKKTTKLSKNGKELNLVIGVIVVISGALSLWYGIYNEIQMHNDEYAYLYLTYLGEFKIALILLASPMAILVSGTLLLCKNRIGWLGSLSSCIFLTAITIFIGLVTNEVPWLYLVGLLFFAFTLLLLIKNFREYYHFKLENLFFVLGVPIALILLVIIL
ncbi:MAG: hypothetical protein ACJASQ_003193 [Crocinitomicaceae bacterium]|jgi:hypothetical protein